MSYARWLSALVALLAIGCSESPGHFTEGTFENAESGAEPTFPQEDLSIDPPVTLLGTEASRSMAPSDADAGLDVSPVTTPASEPPPGAPDAGPIEEPIADDDADDESDVPETDGSMTEPEPPPDDGNGGLVGTVCDLLGGLLCPVGLLCVDGLCQQP